MKTLHTLRLRLEPLETSHAKALFEGLGDAALYEYIDEDPPEDAAALRERYRHWSTRTSPDGRQAWLNWALWSIPADRYVGWVQATVHPDRTADIAYVLFRDAWGHGYAREAVATLIHHLRKDWLVVRVRASVDARNLRSIALLEAIGFARTGAPASPSVLGASELHYQLGLDAATSDREQEHPATPGGPAGAALHFYPEVATIPEGTCTEHLLLRPLRVTDAALDYDAVMSSAAMLRRWSQSEWPGDDFTLDQNRADLERHEREHHERVAFTFTVLDPEGTRCLGCVYIVPPGPEERRLCTHARHPARIAFWVRASEVARDLDRHLLTTLRAWLEKEWAFDAIVFTIGEHEDRQAEVLGAAGLAPRLTFTLPDGRSCRAFT